MEAYFPRKALPMHRRPFLPQGVLFVVLNHLRSLCAELQSSEHGKASNPWKFSARKLYFSPIWKVFSLESFLLYDISCLCLRTNDMDGLLPLQFFGCTPVPSFILRPPPFLFVFCFFIDNNSLIPGSLRTWAKNWKERGEPGGIYHVINVTGRENFITCGQMNGLVHALLTDCNHSTVNALWLTERDYVDCSLLYFLVVRKATLSVHRPVHSKITNTSLPNQLTTVHPRD